MKKDNFKGIIELFDELTPYENPDIADRCAFALESEIDEIVTEQRRVNIGVFQTIANMRRAFDAVCNHPGDDVARKVAENLFTESEKRAEKLLTEF